MTTPKNKENRPNIKLRHYKVAQNLLENGGNKTKAIRDAGYSESTANNPHSVTNTKSFQLVMQSMGLNDEYLVKALVDDIKAKPKNRFNELQLGFKLRGHLKENTQENKTLVLVVSGESASRYKSTSE